MEPRAAEAFSCTLTLINLLRWRSLDERKREEILDELKLALRVGSVPTYQLCEIATLSKLHAGTSSTSGLKHNTKQHKARVSCIESVVGSGGERCSVGRRGSGYVLSGRAPSHEIHCVPICTEACDKR